MNVVPVLPEIATAGDPAEPFICLSAVELARLAERYGTPLFILDEAYLRRRIGNFVRDWKRAFPGGEAYYSYKTNYLPEVCRIAHEAGMGADAVSGYELEHAKRLCKGLPTTFNGPMKSTDELKLALEIGARINIDCEEEIGRLAALCLGSADQYEVGLRVNPGCPVFNSSDRSFVKGHGEAIQSAKFGWPITSGQALEMANKISALGFRLTALHSHLGSQITDQELFLAAIDRVFDFAQSIRQQGIQIKEVNVGGGLGVPGLVRERRSWWTALKQEMGEPLREEQHYHIDLASITARIRQALATRGMTDLSISCEPGRYVTSSAMVLLTRVVGIKRLPQRNWVIVDGGQNLLPTAAFGELRRTRCIASKGKDLAEQETMSCWLGGPLCYEGNTIMKDIRVPRQLAGDDLVMIADAGAYTVSRSTNFNRPRAAVVSWGPDSEDLIWAREEYEDVFAFSRAARNWSPCSPR